MSPVEEYIIDQPERFRKVITKLRRLMLDAGPFVEEKMVYGIPFFYGKRRIFYINPQKQSVELGFCRGDLLGENALLKSKGRKQVKTISFRNISEIEDEQILPIIHEAILVDEIKSKKAQK